MTRKELAAKVAEVLSANGIKKSVPAQKTVFHITDDYGGKSDFTIRKEQAGIRYTIDDIYTILEACMEVIIDAIKRGDKITISGFGMLYLKRRAARVAPHPVTGEMMQMKEHFTVKFDCGKNLKTAAAIYSAQSEEMMRCADDILSGKTSFDDDDDMDVMEDGRD